MKRRRYFHFFSLPLSALLIALPVMCCCLSGVVEAGEKTETVSPAGNHCEAHAPRADNPVPSPENTSCDCPLMIARADLEDPGAIVLRASLLPDAASLLRITGETILPLVSLTRSPKGEDPPSRLGTTPLYLFQQNFRI